MHKQRLFILIAAGVGVVGLLLTWFSIDVGFLSYSQNGFSSGWTGWGTLAAIGGAAGLVFKAEDKNTELDAQSKKMVAGAGAGAVVLPLLAIIIVKMQTGGEFVDIGFGIFICMLAGLGIAALPFAIKGDGEFEMPNKETIKADLDGTADDSAEDTTAE